MLCYTRDGQLRCRLAPGRPFLQPTDILTMTTGDVVVRDDLGLQLFSPDLLFQRSVGRDLDCCFGLAEDGQGSLLTINCNQGGSVGAVTEPGCTDIFYIDLARDKVVRRMELVDVIPEEERMEARCRFLT